jgi:sigma-B regulation protein RsbU (phosphoserine phosphatase)
VRLHLTEGGVQRTVDVGDGVYVVGTSLDCDVRLSSRRVSRTHAELRVDGDQLFVRDLGSTNGTLVDGDVVSGEEVLVGSGGVVVFGDAVLRRDDARSTHEISWRGIPLSPTSGLHMGSSSVRVRERVLGMLTGLFELMATGGTVQAVGSAVCEFCSHLVRADRVVILLRPEAGRSLTPLAGWPQNPAPDEDLCLSATIRDSVLEDRRPLRIPIVRAHPRFRDQPSCHSLATAMAVPLFDNRRTLGILYADSSDTHLQFSQDDLDLLTTVANAAAIRLRWLLIEGELATAARIQRAMEPRALPEISGYELLAYQHMCHEVGGDLYQCLVRPEGTFLLALGDIAGKGMPAALAMGASTVLLRVLAEVGGDVETLVQVLHRHLHASLTREQFLTLFLAELSPETGRLRYVNAGHPAARIVRSDGSLVCLESTGIMVGALVELLAKSAEAHIAPGDLLVVYSDGIPEATISGDEFFGEARLDAILREGRDLPLTELQGKLATAVEDFVYPESPSDDVTLMLLRRRS